MVREAHGLEQLMSIVKDKSMREIKPLLAAATGALWKCTFVEENVKQLDNVSFLFIQLCMKKYSKVCFGILYNVFLSEEECSNSKSHC